VAEAPTDASFGELLMEYRRAARLIRADATVQSSPGHPADRLRSRRVLLVLDNCEHLVEACAEPADHLLRCCSDLQILATSREPLGVVGEHVMRVPPLPVPVGTETQSELRHAPAVELFVERAGAATGRIQLAAESSAAVVEICRRLDGLPLARRTSGQPTA